MAFVAKVMVLNKLRVCRSGHATILTKIVILPAGHRMRVIQIVLFVLK